MTKKANETKKITRKPKKGRTLQTQSEKATRSGNVETSEDVTTEENRLESNKSLESQSKNNEQSPVDRETISPDELIQSITNGVKLDDSLKSISTFTPAFSEKSSIFVTKTKRRTKINWDVFGVVATALALAAASIFFISGWLYETQWYSFYGIEISQINIPPTSFMVQGFPGILIVMICVPFTWILIRLYRGISRFIKVRSNKFGKRTISFSLISKFLGEPIIVAVFSYLIVAIILAFATVWMLNTFSLLFEPPFIVLFSASFIFISLILLYFVLIFFLSRRIVELTTQSLSTIDDRRKKNTRTKISPKRKRVNPKVVLSATASATDILAILFFLLTFLTSISVSSLLGQYDAFQGKKSLAGNWTIPRVYIFSETPKLILEEFQISQNTNGYIYGPLGLITSSDSKYYFVDVKLKAYYTERPKVYLVEKTNTDLILDPNNNLRIDPIFTAPSPTLSPLENTITVTPTALATPSITPTSKP